ncbi:nuclear pore complex protein Nup54 [Athalia rosae]|uniref:nuclear pore complex protein Nup54 n=1 Tax=Athalia rosae TaxID=37344 RepID=UPI0020334F9C|nr:nuclear pore complex protein Nup54 [Athalia rosae]
MSFGTGFGTSTPAAAPNFGFGTPSSTAATPAKPTGFGTPSFGFGTPATSAPAFGAFGTPATQTPAFGTSSGFGTLGAVGFGTPTTSSITFGTPTSTFGFGTAGGFGSTPATASTGFSGFGTTTTTSSTGFSGFGGFPTTATSSAPSMFSSFAAPSTSTTGFGTSSGFGGFGTKPAITSTTGFGSSGGGTVLPGFTSTLTQPHQQQLQQLQQQQQQQSVNTISEALYNAVFNCQIFNDERDNTIARWNLIQALWGTGKAYYSLSGPPIELTQENPLCRFKAIGYSRMPEADNNEGLVVICFNKKESELKEGKQGLITSLNGILGNRSNLTITVHGIKSIGEKKSQITVCTSEKGITGLPRKIPANELVSYFMQPMQKQQLAQLGVENIFPQVKLDPIQLKEYLDNPPSCIDPRLWKQAQLDNPNPEKYIPVPMIGFNQVQYRLKCQEEETVKHRAFLDMAAERIQGLQRQHIATQARLKEHRRTLLELQHRVLQVLVRQEITRKVGLALQSEEEVLTNRFEAMHSQISAPTQFKGRISEMLSQLRMRRHMDSQNHERYTMDPIAQDDIKTYLSMEQQGMAQLIATINADLECLKIIKDGMSDLLTGHSIS